MLPDKKIIAFDLDGTLAPSKSSMTQKMGDLLKLLLQQKIVVVISGGSFKQFQTQFLSPFHNDDSITPIMNRLILLPTSGSQSYEYDPSKREWQLTYKKILPSDIKEKARKLLQKIIDSGLYNIPKKPKGDIIEDRETQLSFSALGQLAPISEKEIWDPDQKKRQKIKAEIEHKIPEATIRIGGTTTLDILPKGFDKAVGLQILLDKMGLHKSDILFVGDALFPGGNDHSVYEAGIETIAVKGPKDTELIIKDWLD